MQTKSDIQAIVDELKDKVPSFFSVPMGDTTAEDLDKNKVMGAIVIQEGVFKDVLVIIKEIEVQEDNGNLRIEYQAVDKQEKEVVSEDMNTLVGNFINYFMALAALKTFDTEEDGPVEP